MDELIQQGRDGVLDIKQLKSDGEERIKDIAADLRRQNAAYTRQLKKSLSDQSKEILENSMADGRTILQEYDENNEMSLS